MSGPKWCTIESDPGVFTELIKDVGVQGVQMEELVTLEDEELNQIKPVYGLIFLFKWVADSAPRNILEHYDPELFYADQVINNACATQAILSILLNRHKDVTIGPELDNLRNFTVGLPSREKGLTIGNSDKIRESHNSFARQDPFIIEQGASTGKEEDAFHFISYVPFNGQLYELDGLARGPISHGECTEENWLGLARSQIQQRIEKFNGTEIRFNLLAVIGDKIEQMNQKSQQLMLLRTYIQSKLSDSLTADEKVGGGQYASVAKEVSELSGLAGETLQASLLEIETSLQRQEEKVIDETERQEKWKVENARRRHNYVPLIFDVLTQLAKKNMLEDLFKEATEKKKAKQAEKAKAAAAQQKTK